MNIKTFKISYLISTGLLTLLMLMSAGMHFFDNQAIQESFIELGFPTYLIYPLATAKLLGLLAIWSNKFESLKEWAYAGFFFNFLLALSAHISTSDGDYIPASMAILFLLISYLLNKKVQLINN